MLFQCFHHALKNRDVNPLRETNSSKTQGPMGGSRTGGMSKKRPATIALRECNVAMDKSSKNIDYIDIDVL
jgi:tRNA G26 N,N-dimethylase Trm1